MAVEGDPAGGHCRKLLSSRLQPSAAPAMSQAVIVTRPVSRSDLPCPLLCAAAELDIIAYSSPRSGRRPRTVPGNPVLIQQALDLIFPLRQHPVYGSSPRLISLPNTDRDRKGEWRRRAAGVGRHRRNLERRSL